MSLSWCRSLRAPLPHPLRRAGGVGGATTYAQFCLTLGTKCGLSLRKKKHQKGRRKTRARHVPFKRRSVKSDRLGVMLVRSFIRASLGLVARKLLWRRIHSSLPWWRRHCRQMLRPHRCKMRSDARSSYTRSQKRVQRFPALAKNQSISLLEKNWVQILAIDI